VRKTLFSGLVLIAAAAATLQGGAQIQQPNPANDAMPSKLVVVVLDPAHGGSDSGARGLAGNIESEIVLDFGRASRVALEAQGFRALLTREGNQSPSFDDRSILVNGLPDAVFVSLHVSSTGPIGTARAYSYALPSSTSATTANPKESPASPRHPGLIEWDRAQEPYLDLSRRLAELVQIQLAQQFQGSPETPLAAPIRQLRTIAAPAIAIEVSSVLADPPRLAQIGQPLGEAVARAAAAFRQALADGAFEREPAR
jgi:N-acetylmuramoyl-L-alanine amidase